MPNKRRYVNRNTTPPAPPRCHIYLCGTPATEIIRIAGPRATITLHSCPLHRPLALLRAEGYARLGQPPA